jgi:hypothetical protein
MLYSYIANQQNLTLGFSHPLLSHSYPHILFHCNASKISSRNVVCYIFRWHVQRISFHPAQIFKKNLDQFYHNLQWKQHPLLTVSFLGYDVIYTFWETDVNVSKEPAASLFIVEKVSWVVKMLFNTGLGTGLCVSQTEPMPWRWRQQVPPKHWFLSLKWNNIQTTTTLILIAIRTSKSFL